MRKITATATIALLAAFASPSWAADYERMNGPELYRKFCASCHGLSAKGDGPLAQSLKMQPADLTLLASRYGGKFPIKRIEEVVDGRVEVSAHGPSTMPVWGEEFTRSQSGEPQAEKTARAIIGKIVEYLRGLQRPQ